MYSNERAESAIICAAAFATEDLRHQFFFLLLVSSRNQVIKYLSVFNPRTDIAVGHSITSLVIVRIFQNGEMLLCRPCQIFITNACNYQVEYQQFL